ncbi:MAG TPA: glycosyltransferase, partial [Aggregatilineales bacterium]|nr:glycosyltransferase [Aggregatilineales bacterium]
MTLPIISIICPVYNEEKNIPMFYERMMAVLSDYAGRYEYELIFTNNASTDNTQAMVLALHEQNPHVQLITLSRNFGYQC